ncbi:MAG TPA: DUF1003 domain-containing protein [Methylomirabilota bacterium]|nr:DUF1003 domain-containing protein [Methylomirabilota bacterium]
MIWRHEAHRREDPQAIAGVVERNICALLNRRKAEEHALGWQDKVAEKVTAFSGSMLFVYIHLAGVAFWVAANLGWIPGVPKWDESFVVLAMIASVEAIFLSTFILITQNRMMAQADKRADLNLQISLLAEHEITRVLRLNRIMAEKLGIDLAHDPELRELSQDVPPEKILETIEHHENRVMNE